MMVLSFRDMATARCSGVTPAAVYKIEAVTTPLSANPRPKLTLVDWAAVKQAVGGKHVCFVLHGFNVDRDAGQTGLGAVAQELFSTPIGVLPALAPPNGPLDLMVGDVDLFLPVLWSGDWYLPVNYPFLLPDVRLTGKYFADFAVSADAGIGKMSFITHSMGARVALEAIQQMLAGFQKSGWPPPRLGNIVFLAPATSDQVLDDPAYADAMAYVVRNNARIAVVSSLGDQVLKWDFPMGNAVEKMLWPADSGTDAALGRFGPQLTAQSAVAKNVDWYPLPYANAASDYDHGDYLPSPLVPQAGWPNGWSGKSAKIGELCRALFVAGATPPWPSRPVSP